MQSYPEYDPALAEEDTMIIAIQVNGKLRGNIEVCETIEKKEIIIITYAF